MNEKRKTIIVISAIVSLFIIAGVIFLAGFIKNEQDKADARHERLVDTCLVVVGFWEADPDDQAYLALGCSQWAKNQLEG